MAILVTLRDVLERKGLSQVELQSMTALSYSAINDLYHCKTTRLTFATLDTLCKALQCEIGDIIRYSPAPRRASKLSRKSSRKKKG